MFPQFLLLNNKVKPPQNKTILNLLLLLLQHNRRRRHRKTILKLLVQVAVFASPSFRPVMDTSWMALPNDHSDYLGRYEFWNVIARDSSACKSNLELTDELATPCRR